MDFVEICKVCTRKVIIKAGKRIFNSDKICRSYCDFYFGGTFLEHTVSLFTALSLTVSVHVSYGAMWFYDHKTEYTTTTTAAAAAATTTTTIVVC